MGLTMEMLVGIVIGGRRATRVMGGATLTVDVTLLTVTMITLATVAVGRATVVVMVLAR